MQQRSHHVLIKPSKFFAIFLSLTYIGAVISIFYTNINGWVQCVLLLVCLGNAYFHFRRWIFHQGKFVITELWQMPCGSWSLITTNNEVLTGNLCANNIITAYFALLNFRMENSSKKLTVILCRDVLEASVFRRLRVAINY